MKKIATYVDALDAFNKACEKRNITEAKLINNVWFDGFYTYRIEFIEYTQDNAIYNQFADVNAAFNIACINGDLGSVIEFSSRWRSHISISRNNWVLIEKICRVGHIEILRQIRDKWPMTPFNANHSKAFYEACRSGNLDLVKWLYKIEPRIKIAESNCRAFYIACQMGHLEIAKYLWQIYNRRHCHASVENNYFVYLDVACKNGHLDVAKFLQTINYKPFDYNKLSCIFFCVCRRGHVDVAKWMIMFWPNHDFFSSNYDSVNYFQCSCINNHQPLVKYLLKINTQLEIRDLVRNNFKSILLNGALQVATYLSSRFEIDFTDYQLTFHDICENGHLETARWLYEKCDISSTIINSSFIAASRYGHFDVLKWLNEMRHDDVSNVDQAFFESSCTDVNILIWLKYHWPNINHCLDNYRVFRRALRKQSVPIVEYFVSLCEIADAPKLIHIIYDYYNCDKFDDKFLKRIVIYIVMYFDIDELVVDADHQAHFDKIVEKYCRAFHKSKSPMSAH